MNQKDLRRLESRCIQEEPPRCQASCPLHVDARALCAALAEGDTAKAWAVLKRHMPLPAVLARICDQPCREACLRGQVGDPVRIGDLERAVAQVPEPRARALPVPPRPGKAFIMGAGPTGLTAAWDLAKKGWRATVATTAERPGGPLLGLPQALLPTEALETEIRRMESMGVDFRLSCAPDWDPAKGPPEGFDVALLAPDDPGAPAPASPPDPVTLAVGHGVFACHAPRGAFSWVGLMALGRRAAVSMDRSLQKVSLTAEREREGPFETRLFTNIQGVEPLPETPMADPSGYAPEEARAEAARCLDCQCLECVKACAYLEHFKAYPKVYARQMYNNEAIVKGHHTANILVDSCMLCELCTTVCPEDFPMAEAVMAARRSMTARGKMPPSAFEFALEDMAQADSGRCALARTAPGSRICEVLFFPGCQLAGSSPGLVKTAYAGLMESHGAGLMLACCGAPALWAGREDVFQTASDRLRRRWESLGRPAMVLACPSCLRTLRQGLPEAELETLWEFQARHGLLPGLLPGPLPGPLSIMDPCAARTEPALRRAVRQTLEALGVATRELPRYSGELARCCGYGGLMHNANPPLAAEVAHRRADEDDTDYVTYCAMCRDRLARAGKRVAHLLDLTCPGGSDHADPAARPDPGFSGRRENRARLKAELLREVWNEEDAMPGQDLRLVMDGAVAELLEHRRIMPEDVRAVIAHAEATGRCLADAATGRRLARHMPRAVTFWVEYEPQGDAGSGAFRVHNAWCHRMTVKGDDS